MSASSFPAPLDSDASNPLQMLNVGHPPAPTLTAVLVVWEIQFQALCKCRWEVASATSTSATEECVLQEMA